MQGDVDAWVGVLGLILGVSLGLVSAVADEVALRLGAFSLATGTVLFYPYLRSVTNRRALARIDIERMEKHYDQLRMNPTNVAARIRIAETLYDRGLIEAAVSIMEGALANHKRDLFLDEHRALEAWKHHLSPHGATTLPCTRCGFTNPPQEPICVRCGEAFLLAYARGSWLDGPSPTRLVGSWVGAGGAILGISWIAGQELTPFFKAVAIVAFSSIGMIAILVAIRPYLGSANR